MQFLTTKKRKTKKNSAPLQEPFPLPQPAGLAGRWCSMAMEKHMDHVCQCHWAGDNTPSQAAPTPPNPFPSRRPAPLQVKIHHHHPPLKPILSQSKELCSTFFAKINVKSKLETLQNRVGNANIDTAKRRECKAWLDRQSEYKIFHKNVIFI